MAVRQQKKLLTYFMTGADVAFVLARETTSRLCLPAPMATVRVVQRTMDQTTLRRSALVRVLVICSFIGALGGCGYSEEQWRRKLNEITSLKEQLGESDKGYTQSKKDLDEARARVEQLRNQLKSAGVDVANLRKNVDEQARALEEFKQRAAQLERIKQRYDQLREKLKNLGALGLKVTVRNNRMVIQLPGDVLFDSGRVKLRKEGEEILSKVASVIQRDAGLRERAFQVAGHTDDQKYVGIYSDNWGLSAMRARQVLAHLVKPTAEGGGGLDPKNWSAAGYGQMDPIVPHAEGDKARQANRRCELIVLPRLEEMLDLEELSR